MAAHRPLHEYLAKVCGKTVLLQAKKGFAFPLPAYLAKGYSFAKGKVFGQRMVFALAAQEQDQQQQQAPSFKRLQADYQALTSAGEDSMLVLAFEYLPSYLRSHLVEARIPFVVIDRQVFLPQYWVDLREREEAASDPPPESLTWSTQVVLLRHLLRHDVEALSLSALAKELGYSAMAMTFAHRQLEAAELATTRRQGHSKYLTFAHEGRSLWKAALPRLRKPWRQEVPLQQAPFPKSFQVWTSGLSALAHRSDLSFAGPKVRAIHGDDWRKIEQTNQLAVAEHLEFAQIQLEIWEYDPGLLAEGSNVDPLSLYLCFQEDPNERVQVALEDLLEGVAWELS